MLKPLILEDNPYVVIEYQALLEKLGIDTCIVASSLPQANELLDNHDFDFAIVDLYIDDELSFGVLKTLNEKNIPAIIITGYPKDKFVVQAIDLSVFAFLTKPVEQHELSFTLLNVINSVNAKSDNSFVFLKKKSKLVKVFWSDIVHMKAEGNYCIISTEHEKFVIKKSLRQFKTEFPENLFIQIFRGVIVNISRIEQLDFKSNKVLVDGDEYPISLRYKKAVKTKLRNKFSTIEP